METTRLSSCLKPYCFQLDQKSFRCGTELPSVLLDAMAAHGTGAGSSLTQLRVHSLDRNPSQNKRIESLRSGSIAELLALHAGIMAELRKREVLRSANNPTGDFAEYLFCSALALYARHR